MLVRRRSPNQLSLAPASYDQMVSGSNEFVGLVSLKPPVFIRPPLTPLIKRLEAGGYVKRARDTEDERQVRVTLSAKGRDLLKQASCVPGQVLEASGMSVEQLVRLRNSVAGLRDNLRAAADA